LQLRRTSKEDLWKRDLKEFLEKLDEVEQKEREDSVVRFRPLLNPSYNNNTVQLIISVTTNLLVQGFET
jgi:hypothetical protein